MQHRLSQPVGGAQRAGEPLPTDALDYHLPEGSIARRPVEPRDSARMMVLRRGDPSRIEHRHVRDLPEYLSADDALVFNTTAVAPARLEMRRATGGRVEGLYLHDANPSSAAAGAEYAGWIVMLRSGGRITVDEQLALLDRDDSPSGYSLRVMEREDDQWRVLLEGAGVAGTLEVLDRVGRTPLPPYILKARQQHHETLADEQDRAWYQTTYADASQRQSVAAPTAGLHFTPELLGRIGGMGVCRIDVTLHVGPGTFKPVTAATLAEHPMHAEWFEVSPAAIAGLRQARRWRGRVIAVGTTTVRTLESLPAQALAEQDDPKGELCGGVRGMTDLLIAPPHTFRHLDGMLTNFHLPRSTLLALVAAMVGLERLQAAYRLAVEQGYRFYSYGDAMLILP